MRRLILHLPSECVISGMPNMPIAAAASWRKTTFGWCKASYYILWQIIASSGLRAYVEVLHKIYRKHEVRFESTSSVPHVVRITSSGMLVLNSQWISSNWARWIHSYIQEGRLWLARNLGRAWIRAINWGRFWTCIGYVLWMKSSGKASLTWYWDTHLCGKEDNVIYLLEFQRSRV